MPTIELLERRATIAANSVDIEARTASLVFSTGAARQQRDFEGPFTEVLDVDKGAIDLSRLTGGPVLNGHRQYKGLLDTARVGRRAWKARRPRPQPFFGRML